MSMNDILLATGGKKEPQRDKTKRANTQRHEQRFERGGPVNCFCCFGSKRVDV